MKANIKNTVEFKAIMYNRNIDEIAEFIKENVSKGSYSINSFDMGELYISVNSEMIVMGRYNFLVVSDIFPNKIRVFAAEKFTEYFELQEKQNEKENHI